MSDDRNVELPTPKFLLDKKIDNLMIRCFSGLTDLPLVASEVLKGDEKVMRSFALDPNLDLEKKEDSLRYSFLKWKEYLTNVDISDSIYNIFETLPNDPRRFLRDIGYMLQTEIAFRYKSTPDSNVSTSRIRSKVSMPDISLGFHGTTNDILESFNKTEQLATQLEILSHLELSITDEWYSIFFHKTVFIEFPDDNTVLPLCLINVNSIFDVLPSRLTPFIGEFLVVDRQGQVQLSHDLREAALIDELRSIRY